MQSLTFEYPATVTLADGIHIGAVASGDLEIVVEPRPDQDTVTVALRTSVDGFDTVWRRVLDRAFERDALRAHVQINDFGATPGMVSLRLAQVWEAASVTGEETIR